MTCELIPTETTERDWQALAWDRMRDVRARHLGWSLDDALQHRTIGAVIRGYAAQLRRDHEARQAQQRKEAIYGRKVSWNGFGFRPVNPVKR